MLKPPFVNSMDEGNEPDTSGDQSGEFKVREEKQDESTSSPWAGDDERVIQDNGTGSYHSNVMGAFSGNKFPPIPDPHSPQEEREPGSAEISDYGLDDSQVTGELREVGMIDAGNKASVANYGIVGPAAGGGNDVRNTRK